MDGRPTATHELLLIRVGHHLWRSRKRKEWPEPAISRALEAVWEAKEQIRVPLRKEWLDFVENRKKRGQAQIARIRGKA